MASPLSCPRLLRRRRAAAPRPPGPPRPGTQRRPRRAALTLLHRPAAAFGGVLVALGALLAGLPGTAAAVPGARPAGDPAGHTPAHPEQDWMGSSIAAHEGRTLAHPERDWMGSSIAAHEGRAGGSVAGPYVTRVPQTPGFDVSNWQGKVDWPAAYAKGARIAYIKATEGTTYRDAQFNANYTNSYYAGFIRGAYHFARPDSSSGTAQANYFVAHGGGWSKDGKTLPPLLDIEYPDGAACYGMSQSAMRSWIAAFVNRVHALTTRWATIYTTANWWTKCTGNTAMFSSHDPLFIARYASTPGALPAGWPFYTFWQHADSGTFPGDQDVFNGPISGVRNLANNT